MTATLFDALQPLFHEHQYCGDLDGGLEGDREMWDAERLALTDKDRDARGRPITSESI
jgi:hypothetical protein